MTIESDSTPRPTSKNPSDELQPTDQHQLAQDDQVVLGPQTLTVEHRVGAENTPEVNDPIRTAAELAISRCLGESADGTARIADLLEAGFGQRFVEKDQLVPFLACLRGLGAVKLGGGVYGKDENKMPADRGQATRRDHKERPQLDLDQLIEKVVEELSGREWITESTLFGVAKAVSGGRIPQEITDQYVAKVIAHPNVHMLPNGQFIVSIPRGQRGPRQIDPQAEFVVRDKQHSNLDAMIRGAKLGKGYKPHSRKNGGKGKRSVIMQGDEFLIHE